MTQSQDSVGVPARSTAPDVVDGRPTDVLLRVRGVTKDFPGTRALDGVDLDVRRGEIHGLCGGNGSGKSTLIKILAGVQQASAGGTVRVGDVEAHADQVTPAFAHEAGIRVVHQDLGIFPDLSVAENMALGMQDFPTGLGRRIRWRELHRRTAAALERFSVNVRPGTLMRDLNRATQTEVAIARALQGDAADGAALLILDEPTAALPAAEVDVLLASLRRYADLGTSIVFVSHRLDEVLRVTQRVTVLRDGRKAGTWPTAELDEGGLITAILGHPLELPEAVDRAPAEQETVLEVEGLRAGPLRDVGLRVGRGEIVGVTGLLGSGRTSLLRAVFGDLPVEAGQIRLRGEILRVRDPRQAVEAGIALVPEDRAGDAAFADLDVASNLTVTALGRYWRRGRLSGRAQQDEADQMFVEHGIKAASVQVPFGTLSGGNQQKGVLARWLLRSPVLLLLDEPTQGVDVGARADIYAAIKRAAADGMGVIVVTSDVDELAQLADRAVILRRGRVIAHVHGADLQAHRLTALIHQREADHDV